MDTDIWTQIDGHRQTCRGDTERLADGHRDMQMDTETCRWTQRHADGHRDMQMDTDRWTQRDMQMDTDRWTQRDMQMDTDRQTK